MKKVAIAICDDERMARDVVRSAVVSILAENDVDADVEVFENPIDLEERMRTKNFDLFLLDIGMSSESGLTFARKLRSDSKAAEIMFVSNYVDKVFDTFSVQPFAFIRKTRFMEDISVAFKRWISHIASGICHGSDRQVLFKKKNGMAVYETDRIIYIESRKNKQLLMLTDRKEPDEVCESLSAIDEKLSNAGFLRIQKSFLVNLAHVSEIFTELIVMSDGSKLPISRGKTREVRSVYMNWLQNKDIIMSDM